MNLQLPDSFISKVRIIWGTKGEVWLATLDDRIDRIKRLWDLADLELMPELTYNLVIRATSSSYGPVVLKLSVVPEELLREATALEYYAGVSAVRVYAFDKNEGALLLERLMHGRPLSRLFPHDDERAAEIAAELILQLDRSTHKKVMPGQLQCTFPSLREWFAPLIHETHREIPHEQYIQARVLVTELLEMDSSPSNSLAHGDLHHTNILESERGWVCIDPKGVYAPLGFDVGCFMYNPIPGFLAHPDYRSIMGRRLDQFADLLSVDRSLLLKMSYCQAVLSVCWSICDNEPGWKDDLEYVAILKKFF